MTTGEAKCQTCGKAFTPCASCAKKNSVQHWRANCDTPECYQVFITALDFRDGHITKQEVKERLSGFDLDSLLGEDNAVTRIIRAALAEGAAEKPRKKAKTPPSVNEE